MVAPLGDRVLCDRRLAQQDSVVLEAGSHNESLRMKTSDLLALTKLRSQTSRRTISADEQHATALRTRPRRARG
jgi:hypothetical protein